MTLKDELYKIKGKTAGEGATDYDIELNPSHFIFKAHFPGEPITPGVCIIQVGKELLEDLLGAPLQTVAVKNVKFLSVVTPQQSLAVNYRIGKILVDDEAKTVKSQIVVLSAGEAKAKISMVCAMQQ